MLKFILTFSILLTLIFSHSTTQPKPASNQLQTFTSTIDNASYSERTNTYYLYTPKDVSGRLWVVDYNSSETNLERLRTDLVGRTIDIYYWIDEAADSEEQIDHIVIH